MSRSRLDSRITVIEALSFFSPAALYRELEKNQYDLVIFSWRFLALDLLSIKFLKNRLSDFFQKSRIAIVIPDHMGAEKSLQVKEDLLINHVDYFLVTNEKLLDNYSKRFPEKCRGVLHDIPNLEFIQQVIEEPRLRRSELIWVGNSKWGNRSGFTDYKGFRKIVIPLMSKFPDIRIVDSALRRVSNLEVLREIRDSEILLQCSIAEGTGLPVLEATALGVIPITTRVGIAEELFQGQLNNLLVDSNVESFSRAIDWAKKNSRWLPAELKFTFEKYLDKCTRETLYFTNKSSNYFIPGGSDLKIVTRWIIRHIKFRLVMSHNSS